MFVTEEGHSLLTDDLHEVLDLLHEHAHLTEAQNAEAAKSLSTGVDVCFKTAVMDYHIICGIKMEEFDYENVLSES